MVQGALNKVLQLTANPLFGLSAAEPGRYMYCNQLRYTVQSIA